MKIVQQEWTWHTLPTPYKDMVFSISRAARNCYQSELKSFEEEEKFIKNLIKRGHQSPLEHVSLSLIITTDRGVLAELTRHRLSSFSVESTRFVKYTDDVEFIRPVWYENFDYDVFKATSYELWKLACEKSEEYYKRLVFEYKAQPQEARQVLNMSLKTNVIMTSNLRQWKLILQQRTAKDAHPQMIALMTSILNTFKKEFPVFFEDI
jgi:thymidylate synthase (FAD)